MEYVSPGDAFSSTLEQALMARELQKHNMLMDQIAVQREQRQAQHDADERMQAQAALEEKRRTFDEAQKDKRKGAFEKTVTGMLPGDIPTPELVSQAKEFGMGHLFPQAPELQPIPSAPDAPAGTAPLPLSPDQTAAMQSQGGGMRFIGTPQQRDQKDKDTKVNDVRDRLSKSVPGSPEERAAIIDYEMVTGKSIPAGFARPAGSDSEPVARQNPKSGVVERLVDGQWTPVTGNVPKGTHFMTVPDHSAQDAAGSARDAEALRKAYDGAVTELNTRAKPIEGHIAGINDLGMVLNERTPQSDALIAPMVLKATVSGNGTGFRMTQSEINQVIGARSKWETLSAALNKWSADPTKALSITDEQRTELRQLAKAIRSKAQKQMDSIIKTRHELDDASDPKVIKQLRTRLQEELSKGESDTETNDDASGPNAKPAQSPKDIIATFRSKK